MNTKMRSIYKMADQRLMCVWQTVDLMDPNHSAAHGTARKATVQDVTASLSRDSRLVHYSQMVFQDNFPQNVVKFEDYVNYVKVCLRDHSVPFARVEEEFEIQSWEICKESYSLHHCSVMESEVFKLWQIFNKLCVPGSMPPVIQYEDVQWLGMIFASSSKQRWSAVHDGQLTFTEFLGDMDQMCFKCLSSCEVEKSVNSVHSWLVSDVICTGWMHKRTKKQANWTSWQKRWFILKPGLLTYYTNQSLSDKKGDIILNNKSTIDGLDDLKTLLRHYPNRFCITNAPFIQIELSSEDLKAKDEWMTAVSLVIRAAKRGVTPAQVRLCDIRKESSFDDGFEIGGNYSRFSGMPNLRSDGEEEDEIDGVCDSLASGRSAPLNDDMAESEAMDESKIAYCMIKTTIDELTLHSQSVSDGKDQLKLKNFGNLANKHELNLTKEQIKAVFECMKSMENEKGDALTITTFIKNVFHLLLLEEVPTRPAIKKFLSAFISSKSEFKNKLGHFEAMVQMVWSRQRLHYVHLLNEFLNAHGGEGEDTLTLVRQAFSREQSVLGTILDIPDERMHNDLNTLYSQMHMSIDTLAQYLSQKWDAYPYKLDPERHPNGISQDKSLLDIVFFSDAIPTVPKHNAIDNFRWKRPSAEGKLGMALFPSDFDGNVPLGESSQEELLFFGSSLANQSQLDTSLIYQHSLVNFTGQTKTCESVSKRPACLQHQNESTLLCPLEEDSGILILGKQEGSKLLFTGFRIPVFQFVYIPKETIYCVDYTKGFWRKMVNTRATIINAQMLIYDKDEEGDKWPSDARKCSFLFDQP